MSNNNKILAVDDDLLAARELQSRLTRLGYEVVGTAIRGDEALSLALASKPDLVLINAQLSGNMDGIEAALNINRQTGIPILLATAHADAALLERARALPASGLLLKPFDDRELKVSLETALRKHSVDQQLASARQNLDATLACVSEGVIASVDGKILFINPAAEKLAGFEPGEGQGKRLDELLRLQAADSGRVVIDLLDVEAFPFQKQFTGIQQQLIRKDGSALPVELSASFQASGTGLAVMTLRGISAQLHHEQTLQQNALLDGLTGLPSKTLFMDRLSGAINRRRRGDSEHLALLLIGLDDLAALSQGLGNDADDLVVNAIGQRIGASIRAEDTVANHDKDTFAVLLDQVESPASALLACQRILAALKAPLPIDGKALVVTASAGIAIHQDGLAPSSPISLMQEASAALKRAKSAQPGSCHVFGEEKHRSAMQLIQRRDEMQQAMVDGLFEMHYQPVVSADDGSVASMEASLRWPRPGYAAPAAPMPPAEFIAMADAAGLLLPLGEYALRSACRQMAEWQSLGFNGFRVSVAFNAQQFEADLVALIREILSASDLDPSALILQISGDLAIDLQESQRCTDMLEALAQDGLAISLDNFSAGGASLAWLQRLPLAMVKLDQQIIQQLPASADQQALAQAQAIIALAHSLNLKTLARAETEDQAALLSRLGCDYIQGNNTPLPAAAMTQHLEAM
ncbi:MAG: EAL domain-containing protein [Pseudomonadales bacterium]